MKAFWKQGYWKSEFHSAVLRYGIESLPARFTRRMLFKCSGKKKYSRAVIVAEVLDAYRGILKNSKRVNRVMTSFKASMMEYITKQIPVTTNP